MKTYIRQKAKCLIKKYGTDNPKELANYLGIMIVNKDLGKVAGSYRLLHRKQVIFVNSKLSYHHQNVVIAHELGHALLHPNMNCCFIKNKTLLLTSKVEREANINTSKRNNSCKKKHIVLVLCIFLGVFDVHRFYVGKIGTGILYLFTCGFLGIGLIFDIFLIIMNLFTDYNGDYIK